jgi:hypothetical protein
LPTIRLDRVHPDVRRAAGGDKRGRQSAALLILKPLTQAGFGDRELDLRIDEHATPLVELRRVLRAFRSREAASEIGNSVRAGDLKGALDKALAARDYYPQNDDVWVAIAEINLRMGCQTRSETDASRRIGQVLRHQVGQEIPVPSFDGSSGPQPTAFGLRHRLVAQGVFAGQTRTFDSPLEVGEAQSSRWVMAPLCKFPRERDGKAQAVLKVVRLDTIDQPVPGHVLVAEHDPRQRFGHPCLEVRLSQCRQDDLCWIPPFTGSEVCQARVPERRKLFGNLPSVGLGRAILNGKLGRRYIEVPLEPRQQPSRDWAVPGLEQGQVSLRHVQLPSRLLLCPSALPACVAYCWS